MKAARKSCLLGAVCAALLLSACGSSGPSKATFIAQADAICTKADTAIKAVPVPQLAGVPRQQILTGLSGYIDQVLPVARRVIGQLRGLQQPSQDQDLLHRYLAALDTAVADLAGLSQAAKAGNDTELRAAEAALNANQPDKFARQYGFKRCGGAGSAPR